MMLLFPPNDDMIAFLRACKETPEDDAPRLVPDLYAAFRDRFGALYMYTTRPEWGG